MPFVGKVETLVWKASAWKEFKGRGKKETGTDREGAQNEAKREVKKMLEMRHALEKVNRGRFFGAQRDHG